VDTVAPPAPDKPTPQEPSRPTKDIFDVIRDWRHKTAPPPPNYRKRMFAGAPVVSYSPTSGAGLGVAGNIAFFKGHPDTTRISSVVASLIATSEKQLLGSAKINASTANNSWRLQGDNRFYWTSQDTYGLGTDTTDADGVDQKYNQFRVYETVYREVRRNVFLGAGFLYDLHTNVEPNDTGAEEAWPDSPYVQYSERYGFDPASQGSAGASLHALVDTRDSAINPSRGGYANASYLMFFEGLLGGTSSWEQFSYDLRTYVRLSRDAHHKLAFWTFGNLVTGGVAPYLDLPATGMDTYGRSGRGYPQGRFRGEQMLYGEVEYRWTVTGNGLFGMVAFFNAQTLSNKESGERLFDSWAPGGGFGFRLMLNKRSQTNLCLDIGFGKEGSQGVYFAVQEAF
jgi:outer membrane protein assembly factor BamA